MNYSYAYHYFQTDCQGNVRAVLSESGALEEANSYYPYGMLMPGDDGELPALQPYKYSGKEYVTIHGLNQYDFGPRPLFSPAAIFTSPDPHCEINPGCSPYILCGGNPITFSDPSGLDSVYCVRKNKLTYLGDDGNDTGNAYIVTKQSENAAKKQLNNGTTTLNIDLNRDDVIKVPSKEEIEGIENDLERSNNSGKEAGSHYVAGKVIPWDIGTDLIKDDNGSKISIKPFWVNGKFSPSNFMESYWHIHPNIGNGHGKSTPSPGDFKVERDAQTPHKHNAMVIGASDGNVTFYNSQRSLLTIPFSELKRICVK